MSQVYFSTAAKDDLQSIYEFIADDNEAAAETLLHDVEDACDRLVRHPQLGMSREDLMAGLRLIVVRKNYVVFYRSMNEDIEIVRVVHGRRDFSKLFDF